jgi:hypothetical protein
MDFKQALIVALTDFLVSKRIRVDDLYIGGSGNNFNQYNEIIVTFAGSFLGTIPNPIAEISFPIGSTFDASEVLVKTKVKSSTEFFDLQSLTDATRYLTKLANAMHTIVQDTWADVQDYNQSISKTARRHTR